MRVISRPILRNFGKEHPETETALDGWYRVVKRAEWANFAEVRQTFPTADKVGELYVFNVGGNRVRLIAAIHFNTQKVYVRHVLTHQEYDRGHWKNSELIPRDSQDRGRRSLHGFGLFVPPPADPLAF
jgi:mRNA interferase HigB